MRFCDVVSLLLQIAYCVIVTSFIIAKECIHWVIPRRQKSVKDEVVVVTGAGHGLGRRVAIIMARLGAFVVCWDKNPETNINTVYDIRHAGGRAVAYTCDVTDRLAVLETADRVRSEVGPVTILINNAGIYPVHPVLDWTPEELKAVFDTNIMAHFWTLKAFLPAMIEQNYGHVVAMSSAASMAPVANEVPYSATKSAVTGLMDGLIQELRLNPDNKVKVTCIHPYYTAVRDDIPVRFELRIERMSPDYVAAEIVKGLRQEREMITIPRFMMFWIFVMRSLPQTSRKRWREIFYTYVWPIPVDETANANGDAVVTIGDKINYPEMIPASVKPPVASFEVTSDDTQSNKISVKSSVDVKTLANEMTAKPTTTPKDIDCETIKGPNVNDDTSVNITKAAETAAAVNANKFVEEHNLANISGEVATCSSNVSINNNEATIANLQCEMTPI